MAAVGTDHEIGTDLQRAARALGPDTDDGSAFLEQAGDFRAHEPSEGLIPVALASQEVEEVPLGHEGEEPAVGRQVSEIGEDELADLVVR